MRWLSLSRVSFQRVGSVLAVVAGASETRPTSLDGISRAYEPLVRRRLPVPLERAEEIFGYLHEQHLWERYRAVNKGVAEEVVGQPIEIQDYWLADPALPSASGAITEQVVDELPQLAAGLRLVRERNYTLTDRGRALRAAADAQIASLQGGVIEPNAFLPSAGGSLVFLYALLEADFDFLQAIYANARPLLKSDGFTRMDFALGLDVPCDGLRMVWAKRVRSGEDRQRLNRLADLSKKITEVRRKREDSSHGRWGGGRTPDQVATLRLEPLVDVGLLTRDSRFEYRYRLTPGQLRFFEAMAAARSAADFIDREMCRKFLDARAIVGTRLRPGAIWDHVKAAYLELKSSMGYASYREVVVLAMARAVDQGDGDYFELADGVDVLHQHQRHSPRLVKFGVARGGGITYVKISDPASRSQ